MSDYAVLYIYEGSLSIIQVEAQSHTHAMAQVAVMDHVADSSLVLGAAFLDIGGFPVLDANGLSILYREDSEL